MDGVNAKAAAPPATAPAAAAAATAAASAAALCAAKSRAIGFTNFFEEDSANAGTVQNQRNRRTTINCERKTKLESTCQCAPESMLTSDGFARLMEERRTARDNRPNTTKQ